MIDPICGRPNVRLGNTQIRYTGRFLHPTKAKPIDGLPIKLFAVGKTTRIAQQDAIPRFLQYLIPINFPIN